MTLAWQDLRLRWRSNLVWAIALVLLALMIHGLYPSLADQPGLDDYYQSLPPELQALLGASDITSPVGYLNSQWFAFFLPAVLLVLAIGRGAATVAGEEEAHTLDLLLAQPLTRASLFVQKAVAVAIVLIGLVVVSWIPLLLLNNAVGYDLPLSDQFAVHVQMLFFLFLFAVGAQTVSAVFGSKAAGIAAASAVAFVGYLVDGLGKAIDWLEPFRPFTPWRWYIGEDPLANGVDWVGIAVLAGATAVLLLVGVWGFNRRQLRA
jgi:ABC-2 type transport system permease protein